MKISKAKKNRRRAFWREDNPARLARKSPCPNCGVRGDGHFMPPSFGEPGFYICEPNT